MKARLPHGDSIEVKMSAQLRFIPPTRNDPPLLSFDSTKTVEKSNHMSNKKSDMDEQDDEQPPEQVEEPKPEASEWEKRRACGCFNLIFYPKSRKYFWLHWEVQLAMPITVFLIITTSYIVASVLMIPYFTALREFCFVLLSTLFFLFLYSYLRIIIEGPGYFPYDWPEHQPSGGEDDTSLLIDSEFSPSGVATTNEQVAWSRKRPRPNRCTFSKIAGRIVIRPDHFCGWTSSWIGKRNHKFFILFNLWGFLYILAFLIILWIAMVIQMRYFQSPLIAIYFFYLMLAVPFLVMTLSFAATHLYSAGINQTSWEEWNKIDDDRYDTGSTCENCADICGPTAEWWKWPFPVTPWDGVSNDEIVSNYRPYPVNVLMKERIPRKEKSDE